MLRRWPANINLFRGVLECPSPGVLRSDCGSAVSGHGRHDAVVGRSAGVCLPSFRPTASCAVEGQAVQGSGAHSCGSVLASAPLVFRPFGASGGCPSVPSTAEGSTQTASLPSLPPEPPRASSDCVSYIERSARAFGFTSAVALLTCPLLTSFHPSELSGQVVSLPCLVSPSWPFRFSAFDSEDCFLPSVSPPFLVSFLFLYCFLPFHVEWRLPLCSS